MSSSSRIRLTPDSITALLRGEVVETTFRGPKCPARGESYRVVMQEPMEINAIVTASQLHPRSKRVWTLSVLLDRSEAPLLLNAESAGGVIKQLDESHTEDDSLAHGYVDQGGANELDRAGEGVPHADVVTFAETQAAGRRHAAAKVDKLSKRRAKTMSHRIENVLLQARAHGVAADIDWLEAWLEDQEATVSGAAKKAAA